MSNYNRNERAAYGGEVSTESVFASLMRKVYTWMTLALVVTGLTAYYVAGNESILSAIFSSQIVFWGLFIAELAIVWYLSARIQKLSFTTAGILFIAYSILNGVTMSVIFLAYTMTSISTTFFITAGTFGAMSLIGYFTKKDLSKLGGILFMALIGLIIAIIVNIFVNSSALDMVISCAGVLIFVGLTAWDTQKIKVWLSEADEVNDSTQKIALLGSLELYLDFINLFIYLLRILGSRR